MAMCCKDAKNLEETNQYIHYHNPRTQSEERKYIHTCRKCRKNYVLSSGKYVEIPNLYDNKVGYDLFK